MVTTVKMTPHYSHSCRANETPSTHTSPLPFYKVPTPPPPPPWGELTIHTLIVENVHDPQLMFPGHICYLTSHFDDIFLERTEDVAPLINIISGR